MRLVVDFTELEEADDGRTTYYGGGIVFKGDVPDPFQTNNTMEVMFSGPKEIELQAWGNDRGSSVIDTVKDVVFGVFCPDEDAEDFKVELNEFFMDKVLSRLSPHQEIELVGQVGKIPDIREVTPEIRKCGDCGDPLSEGNDTAQCPTCLNVMWNRGMTYRQLAHHIKKMTLEQQNANVTFHDEDEDEYCPLNGLRFIEAGDVLDPEHPILTRGIYSPDR